MPSEGANTGSCSSLLATQFWPNNWIFLPRLPKITWHIQEDTILALTLSSGKQPECRLWDLSTLRVPWPVRDWIPWHSSSTPTWSCRCLSTSLWASSSPWVHFSLARSSSNTSSTGCSCFLCFPVGSTQSEGDQHKSESVVCTVPCVQSHLSLRPALPLPPYTDSGQMT